MGRIALLISYDGTGFFGSQVQPEKRTVQKELEISLKKLHKGEAIRIYAAGRTDTAVHANRQVVHFDSELSLNPHQWQNALNSILPPDVYVKDVACVSSEFHARFDAVKRQYRYRVLARKNADVFRRHYTYHFPHPLKIEDMELAAKHLIGTHDFTSFCVTKTTVEDKVRTIHELSLTQIEDEIVFTCIGSGFLHHMVRIIVGTLLEVGTGKRQANDIVDILQSKNRQAAGKTAPGHGLFLWDVTYDPPLF